LRRADKQRPFVIGLTPPNLVLGDLEAQARDPDALAMLLDTNGNFAEGRAMGADLQQAFHLGNLDALASPGASLVKQAEQQRRSCVQAATSVAIGDMGLYWRAIARAGQVR
jgi:hypothetical protein